MMSMPIEKEDERQESGNMDDGENDIRPYPGFGGWQELGIAVYLKEENAKKLEKLRQLRRVTDGDREGTTPRIALERTINKSIRHILDEEIKKRIRR